MARLDRIEALLSEALDDLERGDMYAHQARRPVAKALQELKQLQQQEKENGNSTRENRA
jgi:exonuclease VII small subunit